MTVTKIPVPPKRTSRGEATRSALLAAGRSLFAERPMDAVPIDDIVQRASVAKGSFYTHFDDKNALLSAINDEITTQVEMLVGSANAGITDPAMRLARGLCVYLRYVVDEPEHGAILVRSDAASGLGAAPSLHAGTFTDLSGGLSSGRLSIPTVEIAAVLVLGIGLAGMARCLRERSRPAIVGIAQQLTTMMLTGIGVQGPEAGIIAAQAADQIIRADREP
ncbi:TetR/AcrR family transcriptional regulator [Sphingomonas sp. GB1N7]|uniref:TetR/AcrR family transcriptional regulator n=1 Tax=Parasphingomonas caseinilytica TaxID=3096158 RepID=UPI002FCAD91E